MKKADILTFLKNIRPLKSFHFILMEFFGVVFSWNIDVLKMVFGMLAIFFAWQFSISLNDIFDIEIDKIAHADRPLTKGIISRKMYIIISIVLVIISLIFGYLTSIISLFFVAFYLLMGYFYSAPPLRLRKYIFGTIVLGIASSLAYFTGLFATITFSTITLQQILIGVLILFALSMGTIVKDYKDYSADKQAQVSNIFTKYGVEKGLKISSILLIITFLLPFTLIHHLIDFLVIIPITIITIILYNYKKIQKKMQVVFLFYIIEILYVFFRMIGFIILL